MTNPAYCNMPFAGFALAALMGTASPSDGQGQRIQRELPRIHGSFTLEEAVRTGLRENPGIRAAEADVRVAQAETRIARSQSGPQVSANAYGTTGSMENVVPSAPGVMPTNYNLVPPREYADLNLTAMLPLYTGGLLGNRVRASSERERAASAGVTTVQADIALRIREAYYRALLAAELAKAEETRVQAAREMVRTTRARFEVGKDIEASVRRVEAELSEAEQSLAAMRNDHAKAVLDLKAAMGVAPESGVSLSSALTLTAPDENLSAFLADAARTRPELLAARARVAAADAQIRAAEGSRRPQVYGMAMADGFASRRMSSGTGYTIGLTASLPLLDGGQRRAESERERAMRDRTESELRDLELRVSNEVRQAWLDAETAARNHQSAETAVQAAQSAYEVVTIRFQAQKSILLEQLDALAALNRARANTARALFNHAVAVARLRRAVGRP